MESNDPNANVVENGLNPAFEPSPENLNGSAPSFQSKTNLVKNIEEVENEKINGPERAQWGNQLEFLMSCIAASVGLGNIWRFPFVAYRNGGGAFLLPYIIVLFLVGKPMYYLECILGQFSSRNSVTVWSLSPAMKGTGFAQSLGACYILSYYVLIIGICLYYFSFSFGSVLPWAVCDPAWTDVQCVPSDISALNGTIPNGTSSAELFFVRTVLQQSDGIEGGLGAPIWYLTLCLLASWFLIFLVVAQGVKSSGKAAYFLAIFPYVVMITLLITTSTLPGAGTGILFFLTPQWDKLIELDVWYAAVTQVFFSLTVSTGPLIMYSSYNNFRHNIYRDAMIVTTLDTFTSLLSGFTIFGTLGNLAYNMNTEVSEVVGAGGSALAFVSYPDAISKTFSPQLFSVLFFLMMAVLGVGSAVALLCTVNTIILDAFPKVRTVYISAFSCSVGFLVGLIYCTPGGQYILELVDHYGGTFLVLFAAISELTGVLIIYGLENICLDIEFMQGIKTSAYWRFCWGFITPAMMWVVFIYALITFENVVFGEDYYYPTLGYVAGYFILFAGIAAVPIFIFKSMYKNRTGNFIETVKKSFRAKSSWGPRMPADKREWIEFKAEAKESRKSMRTSRWQHQWYILTGKYRKNESNTSDNKVENGMNPAFDPSPEKLSTLKGPDPSNGFDTSYPTKPNFVNNEDQIENEKDDKIEGRERPQWGGQIEFLMSCIATSVGLGNVWRFPFVAYQNGGGAFLIPYIIVLFLVGKPMYYLECIMGQFSSKNSVTVWALSPAMKGTGYAQTLGCCYVLSYYMVVIALCLYYLVFSFSATLPWSVCNDAWTDVVCVPSDISDLNGTVPNGTSSAELFFVRTVLQQKAGIEGGLGAPIWYLTLSLFISYIIVFGIVAQGVKSSGKAAYFLAIFPYVVMLILLITTAILPGAGDGILFFITPQWDKLLELEVWYAAVTQVFFSLSVCTGALIMFSSYNNFRHKIYRDAMIVTTLDTFTSLLSGFTIFGILGNLAHNLDRKVGDVVGSAGTGLAFVSYPDAVAKTFLPQLFSVLFFLMMSVLGVGSGVALLSTINTVILDAFPKVRTVYISAFCCTAGFLVGLVYVTPGGQYILELVDHYGGTFLILFAAIAEIVGVFYIYGLEKLCLDIEFMTGIKTSMYWRMCWGVITPLMMFIVFVYALVSFEDVVFGEDYHYPTAGIASGYSMLFVGIALVPIFMGITLYKNRTGRFMTTVKRSFQSKSSWGPRVASDKRDWIEFKAEAKIQRDLMKTGRVRHIFYSLTGGYRKNI